MDQGDPPGPVTTAERDELARLRRENRQLKIERDILGKAAVPGVPAPMTITLGMRCRLAAD